MDEKNTASRRLEKYADWADKGFTVFVDASDYIWACTDEEAGSMCIMLEHPNGSPSAWMNPNKGNKDD